MGVGHHDDVLRVKKMSEHATIPSRGSDGAAGYDLSRCAIDVFANGRRSIGVRSSSIVVDRHRLGPVWRLNF
jgi:dUTPase